MPKKILVILTFIVTLASPALANSVAQSQRMLNQLGYNAGPVDGAYGGKTRGAFEKFYADNGSLYDGKLDANEVADLTAAMGAAGLDLRVVHENLGTVVQKNSTKPYVISQPMKTDVRQRNGWYQIAATVQADMNNDGHLDTIYYGSAPFPEGGMSSWAHNNATQCSSACDTIDIAPFEVRLTSPYSNKPGKDITHKFIHDDVPNRFRGKAVMNVLVADFNGDGINDLYMSDTGRAPGNPGKNDPIYLSQPNGTWKEVSLTNVSGTGVIRGEGLINFTHGGDVGDIDGDGDIDVVLPSNDWVGTNGEVLCLMNDGTGQFKSKKCGSQIGQTLALGDYDGDGDLDIFVGKEHLKAIKQFNVMKYAGNASRGFVGVFKNDGKGKFSKLSNAFTAATDKNGFYFLNPIHNISYDWDNDGDIDILSNEVTIAYSSQGIVMYENDGTGKRFSTSVLQHNGFNKDDTGPATKKEFPLDNEISKWNANFALRMMAQDYNKDGLMDFSLEGSAGGMRTSGYGVFINKGNMKFEYVPKNYPEWHSPVNPNWIRLKIRLIDPEAL